MTNFIYRKENALSDSLCRSFIETFETDTENQTKGVINIHGEAVTESSHKASTDISFIPRDLERPRWKFLLTELIHTLEVASSDYKDIFYQGLSKIDPWEIHWIFNMQRYLPGEGYHNFHCERAGLSTGNRMGVWMFYLNDINDKGWTEFYYQQHFEKPEAGKLVMWPTDWTHLHRGITSPTETKYIITGWFSWVENNGNSKYKIVKRKNEKD